MARRIVAAMLLLGVGAWFTLQSSRLVLAADDGSAAKKADAAKATPPKDHHKDLTGRRDDRKDGPKKEASGCHDGVCPLAGHKDGPRRSHGDWGSMHAGHWRGGDGFHRCPFADGHPAMRGHGPWMHHRFGHEGEFAEGHGPWHHRHGFSPEDGFACYHHHHHGCRGEFGPWHHGRGFGPEEGHFGHYGHSGHGHHFGCPWMHHHPCPWAHGEESYGRSMHRHHGRCPWTHGGESYGRSMHHHRHGTCPWAHGEERGPWMHHHGRGACARGGRPGMMMHGLHPFGGMPGGMAGGLPGGMPSPEEIFKRMDANGDGVISKEEFLNAAKKMREEFEKRMHQRGPESEPSPGHHFGGMRPSPDELFSRFDKNKDGKLTKDEVPEPIWEHLSKADANHDGAVTKEELEAARKKMHEEFEKHMADRGHSGGPSGEHRWGGMMPGAGDLFSRFDKNKDGKLTKDEVPERLWEHISKADTNHDGAVTKEELEAAAKKMREQRGKPTP
jgi:Ca2+-binding EF-hand superfamily protein